MPNSTISIISDEVSEDFRTAVELGLKWGVRNYEIREINYKRVPDILGSDLRLIKEVIQSCGIKIVAISPGVFKIPWAKEKIREHLRQRLPRSFELAYELGTNLIIVFTPIRHGSEKVDLSQIVAVLKEAARAAEREGFILALENEPICYADTGKKTARIIEEVASPALKINWDPTNVLSSGEVPYPEGYENVKDHVFHLHVKDAQKTQQPEIRYVCVGEGEVDWKGQISALKRDKYQGYFSVETHFLPQVESSERSLSNLRHLLEGYR